MSWIIAARRSPVAPSGGALAGLLPHELAAPVIRAALEDAGIAAAEVDELILSNALGGGGNPARMASLAAGLPERVGGLSIDRQCVGGLDAILLADALVRAGARIVVAGGAESHSRRPHRLTRPGGVEYDRPAFSPFPSRDPDMAEAAARLAAQMGYGRETLDAYAVASHAKALAHPPSGLLAMEGLDRDAFTRALTPALAARAKAIHGPISAANAAVSADGAAFVVVSRDPIGPRPVRLVGGVTLGAAPEDPGLAPLAAIAALGPQRLDRIELMEAYAAQAMATIEKAGFDPGLVNPQGGALARGHPIGASGAVLAVSLYHGLEGLGLAAIAAAGGLGTALLFQN
ncbi:thiolase family protein [Stagnihabitans tardus]|uniref:Thiolase family protein n=1 Tax=Stagnihabitans tardus TaxID=2699202 RepID=A0AAE5BRU1_9RHOB|nr:thiolase family protein [Stagnihabitans tardus]NBZ86975.1 thiolase family protein [Stagnihabitans tardus]